MLGIVWVQALSLHVRAQALEEQASACEAGARASEGREELLGDEGITDANLMQHLGIIEQRASQLLQVSCCPGDVTQSPHLQSGVDNHNTYAVHGLL